MDLSGLNPEQRRAVEHDTGPILVLAGAGSGKTRVITMRIARMVLEGVRPESILGVTFTNKAAAEMRERVAHLIPPDKARKVTLGTFHALGAQILRSEIGALGFDKRFHILDEGDRRRVMRQVLKELNLAENGEARVLQIVSKAKSARLPPAQLPEARYNPEMPRAQRVYDLYNQALRNLNAVDFDDLLLLPTQIFEQFPEVREKYRHRYRYVLVDEYQDTNPIQMVFLQQLVAPPHFNLMAVGDDDQSIYRFRGAVADNILKFGEAFENGATLVALEQNYRSSSTILALANALISLNKVRHDKTLWSDLGAGQPVELKELGDEWEEADWIARDIRATAHAKEISYDRFAILYRSNTQTPSIEESLRKLEIPYRVLGGQSVFDKKEIKDVAAYFQLVLNPRDDLALRRIVNFPTRGVGIKTLTALDQQARDRDVRLAEVVREAAFGVGDVAAKANMIERAKVALREMFTSLDKARAALTGGGSGVKPEALTEVLEELVTDLGLERAIKASERNPNVAMIRWRNVEDMFERVGRGKNAETAWGALEDFVQLVALESSAIANESEDDVRNHVTLTTIHSSKGLEFPHVYLCGMSDDLMPHKKSVAESGGLAEERRLAYVGITRAKERLVMTWSRITVYRQDRIRRGRSPFLEDLPEGLWVERVNDGPTEYELEQEAKNVDRFAAMKALFAK